MDFTWKKEYELGLDEVDIQHKRFLNLVELLHLSDESSRDIVLEEISRYASYHFKSEEEMMKIYNYSDSENHFDEHAKLKIRVESAIEESKDGRLDFEFFILFLVKWFVNHTTGTDKSMAKYLVSKRI